MKWRPALTGSIAAEPRRGRRPRHARCLRVVALLVSAVSLSQPATAEDRVSREAVDRLLTRIKYLVLLALLAMTAYAPAALDSWAEVEPFKTAVTTHFVREWYFVAYAVAWLLLGMILFRAFCRYVCPLGAVMAIGGWLRLRRWIPRRVECGSRCQLCAVRCQYNAIESSGRIAYDECFQCLDCVAIYHDQRTCPVLVLAEKGKPLAKAGGMLLANSK